MASDTATAKPDPRPDRPDRAARPKQGWTLPVSRLGRTIIALNLVGLAILVIGATVINERQRGLVRAQVDSLKSQGEQIASLIDIAATRGEPEPVLVVKDTRDVILNLFGQSTATQRVRVFDVQGRVVADSYEASERIERHPLPALRQPGGIFHLDPRAVTGGKAKAAAEARADLEADLRAARNGVSTAGLRASPNGDRLVTVTLPLRHVQAVTGVLTIEGANVDRFIAEQRLALIPFILVALGVTLLSSYLLNRVIAQPVRRLSRAADQVRLNRARSISLPDLARRNDELGDLGRSLETMTTALSERMDAIDRFAADVAHEIRNPLTSIRSAVETLDLVSDPVARERLMSILKQDVSRLDRLVTDISNASRLDAELSRDAPRPVDLGQLLTDIVSVYEGSVRPGETRVAFRLEPGPGPVRVAAQEGPLSQVFRNLIDNARSFAPLSGLPDPEVRVSLTVSGGEALVRIDDDGPGLPPDNLETVFERFYTSRPKGAAFGGNSGLGLSIARQIVTAQGGRIWAENRVGEQGGVAGARFVVALPIGRL
ncbi:ATP-binding protein [soil metagenome]